MPVDGRVDGSESLRRGDEVYGSELFGHSGLSVFGVGSDIVLCLTKEGQPSGPQSIAYTDNPDAIVAIAPDTVIPSVLVITPLDVRAAVVDTALEEPKKEDYNKAAQLQAALQMSMEPDVPAVGTGLLDKFCGIYGLFDKYHHIGSNKKSIV